MEDIWTEQTAEEKLRRFYDEMVVYKDLKKSNFFSALKLPAFLRDWLLKRFCDEEGNIDTEAVSDFVYTYLPSQKEWTTIKSRIINDYERVKILARISADIDIHTSIVSFSLPDFGLRNSETEISPATWTRHRDELTAAPEVWGIAQLSYRPPRMKKDGKIEMSDFTSFCPYTVDLGYYKDMRAEFTINEWMDVLLGAIDYNASGYKTTEEKLVMLSRLIPFVENNVNLIELAPKGTGKSYVFSNVSKNALLTDGGRVTRAKMFYDVGKHRPGFVMGNDVVAIDEVKLVQFGDVNEMRSILQGYMERGKFSIGGYEGMSDAGIVFLGNIEQDNMDVESNMLSELPSLFQESALVDRIHGFIEGWKVPRMNDDLKISGWALNSEYFSTIMHELRSDISYRAMVDEIVVVPKKADTRHTEAIKRLTTAFFKLFFPHIRRARDINRDEFMQYCLAPAVNMRKIILNQLKILDKEYRGREIPAFTLKEFADEN